ncbi:hypothetical protein TEA_018535 [Camellia sinensis var. sinensis]|uniref:Uncharacterized protein n=1 Tax=Camellia sinensis var. sinensis TaxID=542762 RepID=A0A4S4EWY0_CAMSN|nr:hypothetical protein TEA_018535 [Camellia sinensis var. sinensis]
MEGVGARLGRSSTRYGPTSTVFNGPVRKWKKKWVHVSPQTANNASSNHHLHHQSQTANHNGINGNNGSHLLLYKWTPITPSQNSNSNGNGEKSSAKEEEAAAAVDSTASAAEEPPRRKFRYIPFTDQLFQYPEVANLNMEQLIAVLEEQKNEAEEMVDDEAKPRDTDPNAAEPTSKNDDLDEKPDINDVPVEESQALDDDTPLVRQDLNESTLDLSLGLNSRDGDPDSNVKTNQSKNGQLERGWQTWPRGETDAQSGYFNASM